MFAALPCFFELCALPCLTTGWEVQAILECLCFQEGACVTATNELRAARPRWLSVWYEPVATKSHLLFERLLCMAANIRDLQDLRH